MNYTRERKIIIMMHNDKIEEKLKTLPDNPGVYLMKNSNGKIIYVGKAVVLKNRVRQYFRKTEKTARIEKMVSLIHDFEYIITDTEDEALILECNLIKKYKPKFNVLLKDDKTYPYIKVGEKNGRPLIQLTRNLVKDGSKYYGPYPSVWSAKEMIKYIKDIYMSILNRPFLDETLKNEEKEKIYQEIKRVLSRKYR
jgi:uvrABC system protein C